MTKDVLVSIRGLHTADGEQDSVEVITAGSYYFKNNKHYIVYEEAVEGSSRTVRNTIRIGEQSVDVIKNGPLRSHLAFEVNKMNVSSYSTPVGQMTVGVSASRIDIREQEDRLLVEVDYALDINYERLSGSRITIDVQSKEKADIHLMS